MHKNTRNIKLRKPRETFVASFSAINFFHAIIMN